MRKAPRRGLENCDEDIARGYLKTAAEHLEKIQAAVRARSMLKVQRLAHRLCGTSAYLGLTAMAKLFRGLEQAASQGHAEKTLRFTKQLHDEFNRLQSQTASRFPKAASSRAGSHRPTRKKKCRIMIVDDHPLLREGLKRLIELQPDLHVCGEAATAHQALTAIPVLKPDIVILDISLAHSDGIDLIKDMQRRSLPPRILALSMHDESLYAERVLRAGAMGYIMKQEASQDVIKAIHCISAGEIYLSEKMSARMLHKITGRKSDGENAPEETLSDRELQVFQLMGKGQGTRQIAEELHISVKTVESYRAHIKIKLNLKNARELTQHAVHWIENNPLN